MSMASVGKVRVKSKKSSNSFPFLEKKKKCLSPEVPPSFSTDFHVSSDDKPLFGPQNSHELIVRMSVGHSVVFQVRRVQCGVPSSIRLDHGDILVMDGSAQSEYEHRTPSGLFGHRVNLTYRWVTQHIASCPLTGPTCAQGLVGNHIGFCFG